MKLKVGIISYQPLWYRTLNLVGNSDFCSNNFSIYSEEDPRFTQSYLYNELVRATWLEQLQSFKCSLIDNVYRAQGIFTSSQISQDYSPSWMQPRKLSSGDLSVLSKHYNAIKDFLLSDANYLLVLEDDAILGGNFLSTVKSFISCTMFDFVDLAGGDGILCNPTRLHRYGGLLGEIVELRGTRTACGYLTGRTIALELLQSINNKIFPIDWALSYGLSLCSSANVLWVETDIIKHGSCVGTYRSWRKSPSHNPDHVLPKPN